MRIPEEQFAKIDLGVSKNVVPHNIVVDDCVSIFCFYTKIVILLHGRSHNRNDSI